MGFQDKIKQRVLENNSGASELTSDSDNGLESIPQSNYFGVESIRNFTPCINLRLSSGDFKALPYSYILEINFVASEGIEILTSTKRILITGRNLKLLYNYLTSFRVRYIQANIGKDLAEENSLFVKGIQIEEV